MRNDHPYRTNPAGSFKIPRAAGWLRLLSWWLHRGPRRLKLARARREAVFGDPVKALEIVYGRDTARGMMYTIPKERFKTRAEAEEHLRRVLSDACTVCGARWSEHCDAGLHS